MFLRVMSDIHTEFSEFEVPHLANDKQTVLVLAGDIGLVHKSNLQDRYIPFLQTCSVQFYKVILVVGNHEHYGGSFRKTLPLLRESISTANIPNVVLLEKESILIDDVAFIGATLWTDCDNHSGYANYLFNGMSDSRVIRTGPNISLPYERKFTAEDSWVDHLHAKRFILDAVREYRSAGNKTVVVVHHGVTERSIHPMYAGDNMNMFFASEMTEDLIDANPTLVIHGHTHKQFDYHIDETKQLCQTRVVVNPRGYTGHEDTSGFDPMLVVEI